VDKALVREVKEVAHAVGRLTSLHVTWKWFAVPDGELIPRSLSNHTNPFCSMVKGCGHSELCKRDDIYRLSWGKRVPRRSRLKQCHAGATELVVPVMRGNACVGLLYLGPVRAPRVTCPYADAAKQFGALPLIDRDVLDAGGRMLSFVARRLAADTSRDVGIAASHDTLDQRIRTAMRHIDGRLEERITVREIAAACNLSPSRLMHLFAAEAGESLWSYVARRRMHRACRLLVQTDLSVRDVGRACGYPGQDYFSSAFRNALGSSPSAYRAIHAARVVP
jgi:AraC-like DNA-binding protein